MLKPGDTYNDLIGFNMLNLLSGIPSHATG